MLANRNYRDKECINNCGDKETGMKTAVRYCRGHDILKDFLEQKASEVINMLSTEWNWNDTMAVRCEEWTGLDQETIQRLNAG